MTQTQKITGQLSPAFAGHNAGGPTPELRRQLEELHTRIRTQQGPVLGARGTGLVVPVPAGR